MLPTLNVNGDGLLVNKFAVWWNGFGCVPGWESRFREERTIDSLDGEKEEEDEEVVVDESRTSTWNTFTKPIDYGDVVICKAKYK